VKTDAISIVEAAYDCESDARTWLDRLVAQAAPKLDRGFGVAAYMYGPGIAADRVPMASRFIHENVFSSIMRMSAAYPESFHRVNSASPAVGTVAQTLQMTPYAAKSWPPFVEYLHLAHARLAPSNPQGCRDMDPAHDPHQRGRPRS
jgi:hypothetical protein